MEDTKSASQPGSAASPRPAAGKQATPRPPRPHVAPTFQLPDAPAHARKPSRSGALALQRTHSQRDLYDADTRGRHDGEFGTHSSELQDLPRSRSRSMSGKRRPSSGAVSIKARETLKEELKEYETADEKKGQVEAAELEAVRSGGSGEHARKRVLEQQSRQSTASTGDLEKQEKAQRASESTQGHDSDEEEHDPNVVTWDSPDDPQNPRNWSLRRRWAVIVIVSMYTLLSPLSSSMIAPALPLISDQFNVTSSVQQSLLLSIFVLAYALGPLFLAPLSEIYGRKATLQLSNAFFIVFTVACAVAQNSAQLTVFRFFAGLGGSAPLAIGAGTVADLMENHERGTAMSIYSLGPLLGPALGPIIGGWIVTGLGQWRWIFGVASIFGGFIASIGLFVLPETYTPRILALKAARLRKETGNEKLHTIFEKDKETWQARLGRNLIRPFILIATQLTIQVLALYMMVIYGTMYLLLTTYNSVFVDIYRESVGIASLNYISLAIGFTIGGQGGRVVDLIYRRLRAKNGGKGLPEYKLPVMMVTSWMAPAGLLIYGWTSEKQTHWIGPNIGAVIFAIGIMTAFNPIQNYLVDVYGVYAASAVSAVAFLRSLAGFGFPLFAPTMYDKLSLGWGNSVLALVIAVVGIPAPFLLYRYGAALRAKSTYCATAD